MLDKDENRDIDKLKLVVVDKGRVIEMRMLNDMMKEQAERKQELREELESAGYEVNDKMLYCIEANARHEGKSSRMLEQLMNLQKQLLIEEARSEDDVKAVKDENKKNTRKFLETKYKNKGRRK